MQRGPRKISVSISLTESDLKILKDAVETAIENGEDMTMSAFIRQLLREYDKREIGKALFG